MIVGWRSFKERRAVARIESQAKMIDIAQQEKQAARLMHALIDSAQASLTSLRSYSDKQSNTLQTELYIQINELSQELYDIREKYQRKSSLGFFLLGPLAAPAQVIKERVFKKRLLQLEQKINKFIG